MNIPKGNGHYHPNQLKIALESYLKLKNVTTTTKRQRILAWLICSSRAGHKVTRFDAEWVGDHCFNTTISELQLMEGIQVKREQTKVPNRFGGLSHCKRYWLDESLIAKAESFLGIVN